MRLLTAVVTAAAMLAATPVFAQSGLGMSDPQTRDFGALSQLSPTHRYWETCLRDEPEHRLATVRACGRVIGARVSRMHTATAHYFRSVALQSLGQNDRALRDLRRAYFGFGDLVREDESNAVARYGRGLSLIRMGHQEEAEQEIARATATDGEVVTFFEIDG